MQIDNHVFYGKLRKLATPIALQSLMLALVAAGDALMLGQVAQEEMTAVSLATQIQFVQNMFMNKVFRVYISPDVLGIELGGALKNVVALAAGMADGLGYGDNTKAALITRGISEISRLGVKMGGKAETFAGLTGIGDLVVTCASKHSRNRKAGMLMAQGLSMDEAMKEVNMVVEGVYSAKAAYALAKKYQVDVPIIAEVNEVLFHGKNAAETVSDLMLRDKKSENSAIPWE